MAKPPENETSTKSSLGRQKRREQERRSRERRAIKFKQMRHAISALERAVVVARTLDDRDAVWDDFLDSDVMRTRHFLRESVRLSQEAADLELEQVELIRLLREHQLASHMINATLKELSTGDWSWKVDHLCELARKHYKPWSRDECQAEMDAALRQVNAFQWSLNKQSTGLELFGWREARRMDPAKGVLQFEFSKTFRGFEMMNAVNVGWDAYAHLPTFQEVRNFRQCSLEVLQQLGPNAMIVRSAQRQPQVALDVHIVYLLFRVRTETGITQCVRSIVCPELMKVMDGPGEMWPSSFLWGHWDLVEDDERSYTYRFGGSFAGNDVAYLNRWMVGLFGCVLRTERLITGRQLLTSVDTVRTTS